MSENMNLDKCGIFDSDGPYITDGSGREPTLREMVNVYYSQHFDEEDAKNLTDQYINQWWADE